MGRECYRYVMLQHSEEITESAEGVYTTIVLPQLVDAAVSFKAEQAANDRWQVSADLSSGVRIAYAYDERRCSEDIVCAVSRDKTF